MRYPRLHPSRRPKLIRCLAIAAAPAASLVVFPAIADHDQPRYQWPDYKYICSDLDRELSDEEFILSTLIYRIEVDDRISESIARGIARSVLAENPECCTVERRKHIYSLQETYASFLDAWLGSPNIMVRYDFSAAEDSYSSKGNFLLNVCGTVTEPFGQSVDWSRVRGHPKYDPGVDTGGATE